MKVNLCKCGILKNSTSDKCGQCKAVTAVEILTPIKEIKAITKAANKAAIKLNNKSKKTQ